MPQTTEGEGQLESVETSKKVYLVRYRFDVVQNVVKGPRTTSGKSDSKGMVETLTGESIPLGQYLLRMSDGGTVRVQNDGSGDWTILALNAV